MTSLSLKEEATKAQQIACQPEISAWVSASAGSGKTKVLTDRVLNLLLSGAEAEKILCITFTKTAAAEMANRLNKILREWAMLPTSELTQQLQKLTGQGDISHLLDKARSLFAYILEVKGGMKIMTIHSFCQSVLKRFPLETGISPSFEVLDDNKDAKILLSTAIRIIVTDAQYAESLRIVSDYKTEQSFTELMQSLGKERNKLKRVLDSAMGLKGIEEKLYQLFSFSPLDTEESLIQKIYTGDDWEGYQSQFLTQKKEILSKVKKSSDPHQLQTAQEILETLDKIKALKTVQATMAFLKLSLAVLEKYEDLKRQKGLLDFDDLILYARHLLEESNMAAWVLYKLDGGIDHILVDEAQDTSPDAWSVIQYLCEEFFSGQGRSEKNRTLFVVGDRKQSIYRFQGADPDAFEKMHALFKERVLTSKHEWKDVPLNISFRSTQPILDLVNYLLKHQHAKAGVVLDHEDTTHLASREDEGGLVEVWPVEEYEKENKIEKVWPLPRIHSNEALPSVRLARKIAIRIKKMLAEKELLVSQNRPIRPGDIMILVQRRNQFLSDLVRALKENNVPVAGLDRLILTQDMAVMDLISLGEFLLLPEDDLTLAEVLKSPLFNLSEEELFNLAYHRGVQTLWSQLHRKQPTIYAQLKELLALTDTMPPFELYTYILSVLKGREAFLKQMGNEAGEALDEFLNLALQFEKTNTPSLQGFLKWLKSDEIEIKRDLEQDTIDAVRIMTVHGSKGLQANIVFLPDTCRKPNKAPSFVWMNQLPLWLPRKEIQSSLCIPWINAVKKQDEEEYNRLLYVAVTRAKDRLYIAGYETGRPSLSNNWHEMISSAIPGYDAKTKIILTSEQTKQIPEKKEIETFKEEKVLPNWFFKEAPEEPMPPKPLSPSKMKNEEPPQASPLTPQQEQAMRRGTYIHRLLQVLPDMSPKERTTFLKDLQLKEFEAPLNLLDLFNNQNLKKLFSSNSLSEVPIVGTVNGLVISGQIDRLVILPDEVLIVDFKTNTNPPKQLSDVPPLYIEQMNAYKCLLKNLFQSKKIRSFLLWTTTMELMELK